MLGRPSLSTSEHTSVESVLLAIGGYSRFQLWATFVILSPEIPASMIAMLPVFVGADRGYRGSNNTNSNCTDNYHRYQTINNLTSDTGRIIFKNIHTESGHDCIDQWSAESSVITSVVQEWNLTGDLSWVTEMFTSVFMIGMMLGAFLASQLADRFGRKKIYFTLIVLMVIFGSAAAFAGNPYVYAGTRFMSGIGVGGFYCIYSIYLMEFLTPSWRVICGSVSLWFAGEMSLALAAYLIPSWRTLSLVTSLPSALMLLSYPFIPETPRWLLCHNKTEAATKVFHQIAKWNGKPPLTKSTVEELQKTVQKEQGEDCDNNSATKNNILLLWTNRKLRIQLIIFIVSFFTVAFTYYGISFNAKNLSGDPYLNMFYMGIVDMIAFPLAAIFSNRFGRRRMSSLFLIMASIFLLSLIILETGTDVIKENRNYMTLLCFLGRFGVAGAWGVIICFAAESFPTVVRSTAMGVCCLFANTGGVLAPQIAFVGALWPVVPNIVFTSLLILTVGLSCFLKEMSGKPLQNFAS